MALDCAKRTARCQDATNSHFVQNEQMTDYAKMEPCERLRIAREAAGYRSAADAAAAIGANSNTYASHENGNRGLGRAASRYAKAYKVDKSWLTDGFGRGPGQGADPVLDQIIQVASGLSARDRLFALAALRGIADAGLE